MVLKETERAKEKPTEKKRSLRVWFLQFWNERWSDWIVNEFSLSVSPRCYDRFVISSRRSRVQEKLFGVWEILVNLVNEIKFLEEKEKYFEVETVARVEPLLIQFPHRLQFCIIVADGRHTQFH